MPPRARKATKKTKKSKKGSAEKPTAKKAYPDLLQDHFPKKDTITVEALSQTEQILETRPNLWLRDVCACEKCIDPHSGQKSFATTELPFLPEVKSVERGDDGSLTVVWANDPPSGGQDHTSVYPPTVEDGFKKILRRDLWDRDTFYADRDDKCRVSYADWVAGGSEFWAAMAALSSRGIVFVHDVPQGDETAVERIGEMIGPLQETFYGRTWDVISKPQAENVAYTAQFLGLHQDLLYYPDPPRVQLLHCLANECDGGESLFSDGVFAATTIADRRWATFQTLLAYPTAYHYDKNGNVYYAERPVVAGRPGNAPPANLVDNVWWSPPFQAPFPIDSRRMANWYLAAKQFQLELERPSNVVEHKLAAGECVVFDNWRVLHGRRQFEAGVGRRHLKGTYVDNATFRARFDDMPAHLATEHGLWTDRLTENKENRRAVRRGAPRRNVSAYHEEAAPRAANELLTRESMRNLSPKKAEECVQYLLTGKGPAEEPGTAEDTAESTADSTAEELPASS